MTCKRVKIYMYQGILKDISALVLQDTASHMMDHLKYPLPVINSFITVEVRLGRYGNKQKGAQFAASNNNQISSELFQLDLVKHSMGNHSSTKGWINQKAMELERSRSSIPQFFNSQPTNQSINIFWSQVSVMLNDSWSK